MTQASTPNATPAEADCQRVWSGSLVIGGDKPLPLAGYAARRGFGEACDNCLEANWLALEAVPKRLVLILAIDALFSSATFESDIAQAFSAAGLALEGLWVVASHSHFAPQLAPEFPGLGACERGHIRRTAQAIVGAIVAARQDRPARALTRIDAGQSEAGGAVYRRKKGLRLSRQAPHLSITTALLPNPAVNIPRALRLWCLRADDDSPLAVIAHWPCHAVAANPVNRMSAAHVGAVRETLRQSLSADLPVIWLPGCSGDIRPYFPASWWSRFTPSATPLQAGFGPSTPAAIAKFHQGLEAATHKALADLSPLPNARQDATSLALGYGERQRDLLPDTQLCARQVTLGPLRLLGLNAEPSFAWSQHLGFRDQARDVAVTGYVGPVLGYLPTPEQVPHGGYEVEGFRHAFGFAGDWREASDLGETVRATVASLASLRPSAASQAEPDSP